MLQGMWPQGGRLLVRLREPRGLFFLKPHRKLPSWEPNWGQRQNPTLERYELWVADTDAESRGKEVIGWASSSESQICAQGDWA